MTYVILAAVIILVIFLAVIAFALKLLHATPNDGRTSLPYRATDSLLSNAERSFYLVLLQTIDAEWCVFAKVRLLDLLTIPRGTPEAHAHRNRVQSKHVDFVLCNRESLRPMLVIELDDASHERTRRAERDEFVNRVFKAAGTPLLRVRAQRSYNVGELAQQIQSFLAAPAEQESTVAGPVGS